MKLSSSPGVACLLMEDKAAQLASFDKPNAAHSMRVNRVAGQPVNKRGERMKSRERLTQDDYSGRDIESHSAICRHYASGADEGPLSSRSRLSTQAASFLSSGASSP